MSNPFLPNEPDYRNVDTERRYNLWFKVADTGYDLMADSAVTTGQFPLGRSMHATHEACLLARDEESLCKFLLSFTCSVQ